MGAPVGEAELTDGDIRPGQAPPASSFSHQARITAKLQRQKSHTRQFLTFVASRLGPSWYLLQHHPLIIPIPPYLPLKLIDRCFHKQIVCSHLFIAASAQLLLHILQMPDETRWLNDKNAANQLLVNTSLVTRLN